MGTRFAPKTWVLSKEETPSSFETWKENLIFNLTIDGSFAEFLTEGFQWAAASVANRGLVADEAGTANARTAQQKKAYLELMLGSIAGYAPIIRRSFFTQEARSLQDIWTRLRTYYKFRKTGALILEFHNLVFESGESHESFWERISAFIDDNLLSPHDKIQHLGVDILEQEKTSPTLLNLSVVHWLKCIHPGLPSLVKQRYATELRNTTLVSLRDEISESIDSLLAELTGENASVARSSYQSKFQSGKSSFKSKSSHKKPSSKSCILCITAKRPANHFLSECPYLPDSDRRYMTNSRLVEASDEEDDYDERANAKSISIEPTKTQVPSLSSTSRRVDIESSPSFQAECEGESVSVVIDSGAEASLVEEQYVKRTGATIMKTTTHANQADGKSQLDIVGEVQLQLKRFPHTFKLNALVVRKLNDEVIAGMPFLSANDIYVRPSKKEIHIGDNEVIHYETRKRISANSRRTAAILRVPQQTTLLPGDSISLPVPAYHNFHKEELLAVEPRVEAQSLRLEKFNNMWLKPHITQSTDGVLNLWNNTDKPVLLKKHEQIGNLRPVTVASLEVNTEDAKSTTKTQPSQEPVLSESTDYLNVEIESSLSKADKDRFSNLHKKYSDVFDSRTLGCYNGASGPLEVKINMGPTLPPQRKGRMPLYNRAQQEEQQRLCDDLDGTVFAKPEDVGVSVENLNPSFMILKPSGKKRLVTAFGEVGQYSKPQPSLMPTVDQVLRTIGQWKVIIKADLTSSYWQMKLSKDSQKYCGIATPFKGIRVYQRGAMGMPGTETALEEMMCRVLGDLITEGSVTKIADDLYVGGSSVSEVLETWEKVLQLMRKNGLRLSASKTVCCPKVVTILGWVWNCGTLQASPHRLSALEAADLPTTVGQLRSYIGSFKFLSRVISSYSDVLSPLDEIAAGRKSTEKITWTDSMINAFRLSQKQISSASIILLPRPDDQLQIITDASQSKSGIAATLYVIRHGKASVGGFFNAKLRPHQVRWLPCEIEALCIGAAVSHFGAEIINSKHQTLVLTDNSPSVMAYDKLCRGQFSSSARVSTFLSIISRYHVKLQHIKRSANVVSDYASRNPIQCTNSSCQLCKFISEVEDSVVRSITVSDILESNCSVSYSTWYQVRAMTVKDILESNCPVPYSTRSGWHEMQQSCNHLRRAKAHMRQGTSPSKKATKIKDVKRYLQVADVARDGLLIVHDHKPLSPSTERIIVPRAYLHGLLVCLHLKLQHPAKTQLKKVFSRAFYALDLDQALEVLYDTCHTCASLQNMHNRFLEQSTSCPTFIGSHYNADILNRACQAILVIRENVSSFTFAQIITDERAHTLKRALIIALSDMLSGTGPDITVRADPGSGWRALQSDKELLSKGIRLQLGHEKYKNKNSIVDKAISELHSEINRVHQNSGKITEITLAEAVSNMNNRIREPGLSAREIWLKRDQFTGCQLPVDDKILLENKYANRQKSHHASAKHQARGKTHPVFTDIHIGDLVYINSERDKTKPKDRYIVLEVSRNPPYDVKVQKFVGAQLRSRIYDVKGGDLIKVKSHKFPLVNSESSDEDEKEIKEKDEPEFEEISEEEALSEEEASSEEDSSSSEVDEVAAAAPQEPVAAVAPRRPSPQPEVVPRRPSRNRRPPAWSKDYIMQDPGED